MVEGSVEKKSGLLELYRIGFTSTPYGETYDLESLGEKMENQKTPNNIQTCGV